VYEVEEKTKNLAAKIPLEFEYQAYLALNSDLKNLIDGCTLEIVRKCKLTEHYLRHGRDEGRSSSFLEKREELKTVEKSYYLELFRKDLLYFKRRNKSLALGTTDSKPVISIVFVIYKKPELLLRCLSRLALSNFESFELILVDNNSGTEVSELTGQITGAVKIVNNSENLHFLRAANQGARHAVGEFIV
ncbi:glycosyltransferase family 2 protein, partial [Xanthomonas oryzae]|uniref:glycosyltransferase family 2 protein n=1 Tax=Xanthomonas oryzae TaxID=347 RepID=UPI00117FC31F